MTEDPIGYAGGVNVYGYCADGPVNSVDPSGLWYRRLHEGTTAEVASGMGFSQEQAAIIGKADADIDNFGVRPPYMPFGDSQSYHFDKDPRPDHDSRLDLAQAMLAEAIDLWKKGRYNEALEKLGQSLHPLQDVDAHMNWGDYDGAIWDVRGHRDSTGNSGNMDEEGIDYDPALVGQHVYVPHAGNNRYNHTIWCTKLQLQAFLDGTNNMSESTPGGQFEWDFDENGNTVLVLQ